MKKTNNLPEQPSTDGKRGFTLAELLVVVGVLALLLVVLLPALAGTQTGSRAFSCLNNQRQVIRAWNMYAEDENDLLPPNDYPYLFSFLGVIGNATLRAELHNWVVGTMASPLDAVNPSLTLAQPESLLSRYVTNTALYHCPADQSSINGKPRVRSISMNSAVGTIWNGSFGGGIPLGSPVQGGWLPGSSFNASQATWLTYGKRSSIIRPNPANLFVLIDENPATINDGYFAASADPDYIIDYPAAYHDGGAGLAFADGHAEIHKWQHIGFTPPSIANSSGIPPSGRNNPDTAYLSSVTSAPR